MRRMGSITKKRSGESTNPPQPSTTQAPQESPPIVNDPTPKEQEQAAQEPVTSEPVSQIAAEHPVATRPFAKAAWKRNSELKMEKPVEEPSPENALRRRIAFVTQTSAAQSEEHDDAEGEDGDTERGGARVGSLEEAVALARVRLAAAAPPSPAQSRDGDTEEEGHADTMPAYGDLIESGGEGVASHASPSAERREHLYKILVIGELGTGKTSIIKRYVHQFFSQHYRATIGVDFALKVLNWDANTIIRLQLWDIAGQERFGNMTRVYYKEAVGAFIVFDVSRVATFDAVVKWKNDLDAKVQLPDGSPIPCILLANKCDQQKEGIVNSQAKMEEYCRERGFAGWFETSAKENINIEEAARSLVNKILLNDKLLQSNDNRDGDRFALDHKIANGENSRDGRSKSCSC